jgi:hypothetical protein
MSAFYHLRDWSYHVALPKKLNAFIFLKKSNLLKCFLGRKHSLFVELVARVAGWFVFKPKIEIWVNFGGPCDGR